MSLHFAHPDELTEDTRQACARLADAGIPLGSQTVLLSGVNDDPAVLGRLFQGLLAFRVRPYYLYQCDPISGSAHFRTPAARGVDILRALRGRLTGYAMQEAYAANLREMLDVGRKNVESALTALARHGLRPKSRDVLGAFGRKLYFATATGEIWLAHLDQELMQKTLAERARRKEFPK